MRKFDLLTPADAMRALNTALDAARRTLPTETIPTLQARGRVIARDVTSPLPMPEFRRSTVDGYAVKASSTPGVLRVVGEVRMGEMASIGLSVGQAVLVHTGGNLPEGADAVIMLEETQPITSEETRVPSPESRTALSTQVRNWKIQTSKKLAAGENVIQQGEDVKAGEVVIRSGTRLREQEMGGLLALGITQIEVVRQPRVALIASGDELVPPDAPTRPGQVRNINAAMLASVVERCGGVPVDLGILPDVRLMFEKAAERAMQEADMVIFMAGSSVGERDFVPDVVNGMGKPGILAHGILFRPGKPTLFAVCDGKPVLGLPGNPVSALVTGMLFAAPTIWRVQGASVPEPNVVRATLTQDISSPRSLEHWSPVALNGSANGATLTATPITSKSNLIFGLVRASGLVCAPIGVDKLSAGEAVDVRLLD